VGVSHQDQAFGDASACGMKISRHNTLKKQAGKVYPILAQNHAV